MPDIIQLRIEARTDWSGVMRQFILASSLLSAVAALAMVAICVVIPKLEWILATVALAAFAMVQYFNFRKTSLLHSQDSTAIDKR